MPLNYGESLLGSTSRIEVPFIKVVIGAYTFGIYQKSADVPVQDGDQFYTVQKIQYPNYLQSLSVVKINGQVNEYSLTLTYPIRPGDDPNFFEKVFSSINQTRKITFSYGDISQPHYVYRNEEAVITNITCNFDVKNCTINYNVSAVSSAKLATTGAYSFFWDRDSDGKSKPSKEIWKILKNPTYGLKNLFYGMTNEESVSRLGLIPSNDKNVKLDDLTNVSPLEAIQYLVSNMTSTSDDLPPFYCLTIHDEVNGETINNELVEELGGPYFKITQVDKLQEHSDAYEITVGYPNQNIITSFSVQNNENYSIYYNWQEELTDSSYVMRLSDSGDWESTYAANINSKNQQHVTKESDKTWWSKVTQYPISATIQLKGLLRPATLMQYVHLKVLFFGRKHISSGTYIVTKQTDQIDSSGYRTTLGLTRVNGENDEYDN